MAGARLRAAQEAARQAGGFGASGRPRVPRDLGVGRDRCAGGARPADLRRRVGDRADVLPDGRVPGRILVDASMPGQTPRARGDLRLHERCAGAPSQGRSGQGRTGRLRPQRPVHRPPGGALEQAVCRAQDGRHPGDGQALGVAARAHSCRRSHHYRPWRLPAGEPDRPSQRAARRGRARLGTFDLGHPCATSPTTAWAITCPIRRTVSPMPISGSSACRPSRSMSQPIAGAPAALAFRTGTTTSPSRCSAWPPSPRASIAAACRAIRPIPNRSR